MPKRKRALAEAGNANGQARYNMYKSAYERIATAKKSGFHLEAITIIESLITDRLESRLSFILKADFSFQNLGPLIKKADKEETDAQLKKLVTIDLDKWRIARNKALHEMTKIAEGDTSTWQDRVNGLQPVSDDGIALLQVIDKRIRKLKP